ENQGVVQHQDLLERAGFRALYGHDRHSISCTVDPAGTLIAKVVSKYKKAGLTLRQAGPLRKLLAFIGPA
ncbi:MAG TPA: hypothetical protein PLK67_19730, partial [Bryobacteraceae bacterium]|nr:hypothetical protein [Bryobacteraceae bacterium]